MAKLYEELSRKFEAYQNCNNIEWKDKHRESIENLIEECLPSGSGIDAGNKFNFEQSKKHKLVIDSSYHAMTEQGFYDDWIDYQLIITPSLSFGLETSLKGKFGKYNHIKDSLLDLYHYHLTQEVTK